MNLKRNIYLVNFFTIIIPVLVISMITYFIFSVKLKEQEELQIEFISQNIEKYLDEKILNTSEMLIYLERIYKSEDDYVNNTYNINTEEERTLHLLHHMKKLSNLESAVKFLAYGTAKKQMFFDDNAGDQNLPFNYDPTVRPWYKGALNSKGYYLSDIFIHIGTKEPIVTLSKKIEINGEKVGVLTALLNLSNISKTLSEYTIGKNGHFIVLNKDKKILIENEKITEEEKRIMSDINLSELKNHEIIKNTPNGKIIFHIHKLKKINAYLVGIVFEKDIYTPLYKLRKIVLTILFLSLIFITVILYIFGNFFDKSLNRLSYVLDSISNGNYTKNIDHLTQMIGDKSEFKIIKDAIKNMNYEIVKRETELKYISETDQLTEIYNRRAIINFIEIEIQRAKDFNSDYTLIMFDLDKFKRINDKFGHLFGDEVLKKVCQLVKENIKKIDRFGRYGGEEFLILLPGTTLYNGVIIADRLRKKIEEMVWKEETTVTVSMGVIKNMKGDTLDLSLERVDNLLYKAKNNGRNRVEFQKCK